ncbi:hypothetical protein FQR65_LT02600 [Abscondita terminalis]|nr:hypothetical protein FQR65_LT02600 [Abscondita terminalis]
MLKTVKLITSVILAHKVGLYLLRLHQDHSQNYIKFGEGLILITKFYGHISAPYFPTCYGDDPQISKCLLKQANTMRPYIVNGVKEIRFPSLNPYIFPNFFLNHTSGDYKTEGYIRKFTFLGFDKYVISEVLFYPKDVLLRGKVHFQYLPFASLYHLKSNWGSVPLSGKGQFGGLMQNVTFGFTIIGDLISKDEVKHCKITNFDIRLNIEHCYLQVDGLKHPDGSWGNTNELFRKNSDLTATLLTPALQEIFKKYIREYMDWFLEEFSFNVLFPNLL